MSIWRAAGSGPRPGIRMMSPARTTRNPAPALGRTPRTSMTQPFGAPRRVSSSGRAGGVRGAGVRGDGVPRHGGGEPGSSEDRKVGLQVREAGLEGFEVLHRQVLPPRPAMVLQGADGRDEDRRARGKAASSADNVDELFRPQIGSKSHLRHDDLATAEAKPVPDERVVAV